MERVKEWEKKIPKRDLIARAVSIIKPNWERASVTQGAAEMAYFILLSLIPILLVVANIIPLLPMETAEVLNVAQDIVPPDVYSILEPTLANYLQSGSGGAITLGVIAAIWSASKIVNSLRRVLDDVYGAVDSNNFIIDRVLSMVIMLGIVIVMGVAVFIFVFGEQLIALFESLLGVAIPFMNEFLALRWVILLVLLLAVFMIVYQFVPNHHLPIKYALPGALFSTLGWLILSEFFSLYVSVAGGDAVANATLGTFIILMLYLYISSIILLLGGLINVVVYEWINHKSVHEFETEHQRQEELDSTDWTGYPVNPNVVLLKRKLFKVNTLKEAELKKLEEEKKRTDNKSVDEEDKE